MVLYDGMVAKKSSLRGSTAILTSALFFGTYGIWSRLMGETFPPFYQTWVRSLIVIVLMLPFMVKARSFQRIQRKDWPVFGIFIAFCVCTQVPLYYAYNHASIGTVQLVFYSTFVITMYLVGWLYLKETITKLKLLSMLLAFVGLLLVFGAAAFIFAPLGLLMALLNGVAGGVEVASSKKIENKYSPALITFYGWVATFVVHLPISLLIGETQVAVNFSCGWLLLAVYTIISAAAFWIEIIGFRLVDASIGSLIGLMEIIFAVIFGVIIFHETLSVNIWTGGAIIVFAAMLSDLVTIIRRRRAQPVVVEPIQEALS